MVRAVGIEPTTFQLLRLDALPLSHTRMAPLVIDCFSSFSHTEG